MKTPHSLQRTLSRLVIVAAFIFMVVGGLVASAVAFLEAKDTQDDLLREIAMLVSKGYSGDITSSFHKHEDGGHDISILIQPIRTIINNSELSLPDNITDKLQTISLSGEPWRVLGVTQVSTGERYIIGQATELRDDLAIASGLTVFLPVLSLVILMLFMIHWMIKREFKPLNQLANQLKHQNALQPQTLSEEGIPLEISPFVTAINELLERIQHTLHEQQRFIADAAHELRTPVTALSLLAENVEKAPNEIEKQARQQQLQKGLQRLRSLLNQLLDLARLQSNQQNPKQSVSFKTIVLETIAELYPLAEEAGVDLGVTKLADVSVLDQDEKLQQLVNNAISNAIRYTPKGGQINVSLETSHHRAIFQVVDTGKGIPENLLSEVFKPFYRVQSDTSAQDGNGLGLTIIQEIAQRLEGQIELRNRPEGGLIFTYTQSC